MMILFTRDDVNLKVEQRPPKACVKGYICQINIVTADLEIATT